MLPLTSSLVGSGTANALTTDPSSDYTKGTGGELPRRALKLASLRFARKNIDGISIGGEPGMLFAVMPPELFYVLGNDLEDQKLSYDVLTDQLFDNRIRSTEGWRGRLYGIDIITSNALIVPTDANAGGTGGKFKFYVGTRRAVAMGIQPPVSVVFDPTTNQNAPNYVLRQTGDYGRVMVNPHLLEEVTLQTVSA